MPIRSNEITEHEIEAIKFYMGDAETVAKGVYSGGAEAYNVINALLHAGIYNEKSKTEEGRYVVLKDVDQLEEYLDLSVTIMRALEKFRRLHEGDDTIPITTYRIDRKSSVMRFLREGCLIEGFTSTCKSGFLPEYAAKKKEVAMLEIIRDETVPYVDFSVLFGEDYSKENEKEILLPFGMIVKDVEEIPLTEEEKNMFQDMDGCPPCGKWRVKLTSDEWPELVNVYLESLYAAITSEKIAERARQCMLTIAEGKELKDTEERFYDVWKTNIQTYLAGTVADVYRPLYEYELED